MRLEFIKNGYKTKPDKLKDLSGLLLNGLIFLIRL